MIWALLTFGFGVWLVFFQRDASPREKFVSGIVAISLSGIPLIFQAAFLVVEFVRVKGSSFRLRLFIHRLSMNILGDYGPSVHFVATYYLHNKFGHYENKGFMWRCVAFAAKLFGIANFGDAFSGSYHTRAISTVLWLDECKNVWGCKAPSGNEERSTPVEIKIESKWLQIWEMRKIWGIWEIKDGKELVRRKLQEVQGREPSETRLQQELLELLEKQERLEEQRLLEVRERLWEVPETPERRMERELQEKEELKNQVREVGNKVCEVPKMRERPKLNQEGTKVEFIHSWFSEMFGLLSNVFSYNDSLDEPVIEVEFLRVERTISKVIREAKLEASFIPRPLGEETTMPAIYRYHLLTTGSQDTFFSTLYNDTSRGFCVRDDALEFCKLLQVLENDSFVVEGKPWGFQGNILVCEQWKVIVDSILAKQKKVNALRVPHLIFV